MVRELLVTWIAPSVDNLPQLAWLNELGRIQKINNVKMRTLTGNQVLLDDVANVLSQPADVVIWSGHGTPGGLLLSNSSLVRTKWLASQVTRGHTRLVILAACSSQLRDKSLRSLTETLCRSGVNVIGFPAAAGDCAAGTFTVECVRALSVNMPVAVAFDVALEAIADEATASGVFLTPGIRDAPFNQEMQLLEINQRLARIEAMLLVRSESAEVDVSQPVDLTDDVTGGIQPLARGNKVGHIRGIGTEV